MKKIRSAIMAFALLLCYVTSHAYSITNVSPQVCTGSTITMTTDGTGGTWSSSNSSVGQCLSPNTGVVKGIAAGTTTITYAAPTFTVTAVLTVNQTPSGFFWEGGSIVGNGNNWLCPLQQSQIIDSNPTTHVVVSGGTWSTSNTSIATIDPLTGIAMGVAAGTITFTYTMPNGCYNVSASLGVYPSPDPISGNLAICNGNTTTLSSNTGYPIMSFNPFTSSNTAVATCTYLGSYTTGVIKGVSVGTATITYSSTKCYTTAVVTVGATIAGSGSVCVGSSTPLTGSPAGGTWTSSAPSKATVNSTTGVVTGISVGTVNITYTSGSGCLAITTMTVNASVTGITGAYTVCQGSTTTLSNATGGGTWSSNNVAIATVDASGVVTGITSGTTTITYTVSAGCYATVDVTVNASPSISGPSSVDYGSQITLSGTPTGGTWSSSATTVTIGTNGVVSGAIAGTCTITYTLASGCYATMPLTVNPAIYAPSLHVCIGGTGTLYASPTGGSWTSSDATIATVTSPGSQTAITGVAAGTATITYTYSGGVVTTIITVNPMPVLTGVTTACIGSPITISVLNGSSDYNTGTIHTGNPRNSVGLASYSSSTIVLQTGNSPGTDTLWYRAWGTNACWAQIDVTATKNDSFTFSPDPTPLCVGNSTTLTCDNYPGGVWQIPAAPQYMSEVSYDPVTGAVSGLGITPGYTIIPVWYFFTNKCVGYTQIIIDDCGPKAQNAGNNENAIGYSIAPNPSDGHVVISRSETCTQPVSVKVVSMVGATIYEKQHSFATGGCELSLSNVPAGMYIVELKDANGALSTQKIVVQR